MDAQEVFSEVSKATVRIRTLSYEGNGLGTGFFVHQGGYILTNNHVIDNSKEIIVITNEGYEYKATIVASSEVPDLALIKADIKNHDVILFSSDKEVQTGMEVVLVGYPELDLSSATLNSGRISNTDRNFNGNPVFQLDVSANHGNSGGPVVDSSGRLVGVMTFGLGSLDIDRFNFAIKVDTTKHFVEESLLDAL